MLNPRIGTRSKSTGTTRSSQNKLSDNLSEFVRRLNGRWLAVGALVAVLALVLFNIISAVRIHKLEKQFRETRGFALEMGETREKVDFLEQNIYFLGKTANDIRGVLNLNPLEFSFFQSRVEANTEESQALEETGEEKNDPLTLAAFDGIDFLAAHNRELSGKALFFEARQNPEYKKLISSSGLLESRASGLTLNYTKGDIRYFTLGYDSASRILKVTGRDGRSSEWKTMDAAFFANLKTLIKEGDKVLASVKEKRDKMGLLSRHKEVTGALSSRWIRMSTETSGGTITRIVIEKKDGTSLLGGGYDEQKDQWYLEKGPERKAFTEYLSFENEFLSELRKVDDRPASKIAVSDSLAFVERIFSDPAFVAMLGKNGMKPVLKPRHPDSDFTYYDLLDIESGKRVGSYAVESTSGRIYIMDADEQPLRALATLRPEIMELGDSRYETEEEITAINDLYSSADSVNILLVGKHENNTDTLIVVHADRKKKTAVMFSLPRDLWLGTRRINSLYGVFGTDRLVKEVSTVTGLKIDYYMIVEMFAFIEIVDILGGIEVSLTEDLIDPYYRYKDADGREVTLHYTKGTHHLTGREALRVARFRYTSSDYSRSKRQQLIIMGIKDRVMDLSLKDMGKTLSLIKTVMGYLETDMNPAVVLRLLKDFGQCDVTGQNTIDTSNVLYASYSNLYLLSPEEQAAVVNDENYEKGAWICLPRNNDWNLIRWYVRKLIN